MFIHMLQVNSSKCMRSYAPPAYPECLPGAFVLRHLLFPDRQLPLFRFQKNLNSSSSDCISRGCRRQTHPTSGSPPDTRSSRGRRPLLLHSGRTSWSHAHDRAHRLHSRTCPRQPRHCAPPWTRTRRRCASCYTTRKRTSSGSAGTSVRSLRVSMRRSTRSRRRTACSSAIGSASSEISRTLVRSAF